MTIDWQAIWGVVSSENAQKVYAAIFGGVTVMVKTWWDRRDYYQASVGWSNIATMYGPQDVPTLTVVNTSEKPLSVTSIRMFDGWRRQLDNSPFFGDDPDDFPTLPRIVQKGESTRFYMDSHMMGKALKRSGPIIKLLHLPRVYIGVTTMGRGRTLFVAERALDYDVRWPRYH